MQTDLILVHGLFAADPAPVPDGTSRAKGIAEHGEALGVCDYEWVAGRGKRLANHLLMRARGTRPAVDAVELIGLNAATVRASLTEETTRTLWRNIFSCEPRGFDPLRSFILIGKPRQLVTGATGGQRLLWFGHGLGELSEAEFVAHYTERHGPLVAGYAQPLGLRSYRQVPSEQGELCDALRELGLGQAVAPPVFAELVMGTPPINLASLRARRVANREIKADEKRHIDFPRSMLLLV